MPLLTVTIDDRAGFRLKVSFDRFLSLTQKSRRVRDCDLIDMALDREGFPIQKIAATINSIKRRLVRSDNQAGETVARVADKRHVAPGVCGVAGVDSNGIAMHAADWFSRNFVARSAPMIAQNQLVCRK